MARHMTYVDCCTDPNIFGPWFSGDSWGTWRVVDKAIFGLPLTSAELAVFTSITGLTEAPTAPCKEAWLIFGRRGGKDVKAASYATWLATIGAEAYEWRSKLTRGERGVVQLLAVDRDQAKVCFGYTLAFFEMPMLEKMVRRITADSIELKNNLTIEITTAGAISVKSTGDLTATSLTTYTYGAAFGISARSRADGGNSGNVIIDSTGDIITSATNTSSAYGSRAYGIRANTQSDSGTAGEVFVTNVGDVTAKALSSGTGPRSETLAFGMQATSIASSGSSADVSVENHGEIIAAAEGAGPAVRASGFDVLSQSNAGNSGAVTVTSNGAITATASSGGTDGGSSAQAILANSNATGGSAGDVTVKSSGDVTATATGEPTNSALGNRCGFILGIF